jgi:hypothetical protein
VKGKHRRARQNQLAKAAAAERERLRCAIAAEADRGAVARTGAGQTRVAHQRLRREQATTESRLKPHEGAAGRLVRAAMQASTAIAEARSELEAVDRELSRFSDANVQQTRQLGVKFRLPDVHRSADERYVTTWYRKKTGNDLENRLTVRLHGWIPDGTPNDLDVLRPFALSTAADITPQACWAWAIPPWLRHPDTLDDAPKLRRQLGATTSGAPQLPPHPYPGPPLPPGAVLSIPWRHAPVLTQPADAPELAYWYQRSAWAQQWHPETAPVPFWLPVEHAVAYPQARPLPPGTDDRLPYPAVFAAFATGWRIDPDRTGDLPPELATAQLLMLYARGQAARYAPANLATHLARLQGAGLTGRTQLPTPLEALDQFGGVVEGLMLLAHPDGTPRDEFAWCIAVGHPTGFPIARITVPASRTVSAWRGQVDNITAGIALSCWHEPLATTTSAAVRGPADPDDELAAATAVRILDIDATSPPSRPDRPDDPSSTTRPHLRRGHWRQQRVGQGRRETRWTWVRATTVSGLPATIEQIYVLR